QTAFRLWRHYVEAVQSNHHGGGLFRNLYRRRHAIFESTNPARHASVQLPEAFRVDPGRSVQRPELQNNVELLRIQSQDTHESVWTAAHLVRRLQWQHCYVRGSLHVLKLCLKLDTASDRRSLVRMTEECS